MFGFLAGHRRDLFPDGEFEDLFPSGKGRPSIPASVMASILVLQTLGDLSDRETAEAARCDLRWKVATGMALDHAGFDASTLVYWRRRLAKSERPHRINDAVKQVIEQTGILRGRRKRAVDSTILADAVATQDTITQLISAIRRVGRLVPGAAKAVTAVCTGHDYSSPGKPVIDWDEPGAKDALVSALVNDANALVEVFAEIDQDEWDESAQAALALLALVAGQDRSAPTRQPAPQSPPRLGRQTRTARQVPQIPAQRGTGHLPDRQPRRPPPQTPLPRHHQEQRLADPPHRRTQPTQPHRPRTHPHRRSLGTGGPDHLTRPPSRLDRPSQGPSRATHRPPRRRLTARTAPPRADLPSSPAARQPSRPSSPNGPPQNRPNSAPS
jgi:hypothetical protein